MTLNRQRLLRYAEYAAVSASVAGAIAAVATRQLVYGVAPLSVAAALNLANRRQWEQQIEQRLTQTTTQISQSFDALVQQNRQLDQRLQAIPDISIENFAQVSDLQTLREDSSRLFQQLSDDLQNLRQNLAQQERGIDRSELNAITADLQQLRVTLAALESLNVDERLQQLSDDLQNLTRQERGIDRSDLNAITADLQRLKANLAALESLNVDERLQRLDRQVVEERTGVEESIALFRTDFDQLRNDLHQVQSDLVGLQDLVGEFLSTTAFPQPDAGFQWQPPQLPYTDDFTLEINLGIDFGTGFTKVCFRDLASNRSEIVTFSDTDKSELQQALLPTKIAILEDGKLLTGLTAAEWDSNPKPVQKMLEFLKMRLAHLDLPEEENWRLEQIPELDNPDTVEYLCAYYLSRVITRAQHWIQHHRSDLFIHQVTRWSLNIGVPVEYCESPALERFRRVLSLAWLIANTPSAQDPLTLNALNDLGTYLRHWMQDKLQGDLDCFTTPEISAAVWSFLSSRQAVEKVYTFFDFGDGTLDGTAFRFWREGEGDLKVDFYAGRVQPLGVTAFTQQTAQEIQASPETIRQALLAWELTPNHDLHTTLQTCQTRHRVQKLVASVVMDGKKKHQGNRGYLIARNELGKQLDVFVGGGGGHNAFLQNTVQDTHAAFKHDSAGIPPYRIKQIPVPSDLTTNGLAPEEFHRFAVAYGLCIPAWEGPEIRLPRQVEWNAKPPSTEDSPIPRYEDTRDMM
ncbi:hypothetical protein GFS31_43950 (plasmid) [Leptolyngbya sp. BL0902]|uniref:hypothetical protein n=1 Tax=Leptolyngbya sp. BL0902 TaxID=1115757 RepID=UPI0018E7438E|nr:hypothetical protein [Leptolyngbya sp. BL0902]QQE67682.1 hypothetical protein GFS31_43950 [Leptolyngbya sp. BL0902]